MSLSSYSASFYLLHDSSPQGGAYGPDTLCVGMARVGSEDQVTAAGPMKSLLDINFGPPLHSLIIAGTVHIVEQELLDAHRLDGINIS